MILASQSPRRKEILNFFTLPFRVEPSHFDEESVIFENDPALYTMTLAQKKGDILSKKFPDEIVIAADTVVHLNGKIYNKPHDKNTASLYLKELSAHAHDVISAISISQGDKRVCSYEKTIVQFNPVTDDQIEQYLSRFAFSDKAGGYAIQQGGGLIVSRIEGCYYNVMGFPINTLAKLLHAFGIDLWKNIKVF